MGQSSVEVLLIITLLALFLIVFALLYYLLKKTSELEKRTKQKKVVTVVKKGGPLLGLLGKEIWDALSDQSVAGERNTEIRKRYAYILQRHIEEIVEQGIYDAKKGIREEPEPEASIGGTKGEVLSWIPAKYVKRLYNLGRDLSSEEEREVASETLQSEVLEMLKVIGLDTEKPDMGQTVLDNIPWH